MCERFGELVSPVATPAGKERFNFESSQARIEPRAIPRGQAKA